MGREIARYRLPLDRGQGFCTVLVLFQDGDTFTAAGGKYGSHTITTADKRRVRAHWAGYCSNHRGLTVKPATIKFREAR